MPAPGFFLTGSLNLLVRVRNKRAIDTQVWSLSGNRGNMWQQAHVPINPPGPFQVSQVHSQGATCHLSCPCAMGCRRLPSRHLPPRHRGWSGTGRALGTLYPPGSLGQGKSLVDAQKSNPLLSESIQRYVQASVWHYKFSDYCWSGNCLSKSSFWYQVCVTGLLVLSSWGVLACWCKLTLSARSFF